MPPASLLTCEETVDIESHGDVAIARRRARLLALEAGFSREAAGCVAIAVSEASTNIVKYGVRGSVRMCIRAGPPVRFEFIAEDRGCGIDDLALAQLDGISEGRDLTAEENVQPRRGLGCGLGAIRRLMDRVRIASSSLGTAIFAEKDLATKGPRKRRE